MRSLPTRPANAAFAVLFATLVSACSDGSTTAASASAPAATIRAPRLSADPTATAAPKPSAAPAPSAAPLPNRTDCPKDSEGPGTVDQPCVGKGSARMMEAKWTGKTDDKGPFFAVTNKSPSTILYGKIVVYFYDKAGKQLEAKDASGKAMPYVVCAGANLFSGVMKPAEKATIQFSCVPKSIVPEGATAIEGELLTVGFADADGKKNEFYWSNKDLTPDARPKGGVK
jgi:hypothetical protein